MLVVQKYILARVPSREGTPPTIFCMKQCYVHVRCNVSLGQGCMYTIIVGGVHLPQNAHSMLHTHSQNCVPTSRDLQVNGTLLISPRINKAHVIL